MPFSNYAASGSKTELDASPLTLRCSDEINGLIQKLVQLKEFINALLNPDVITRWKEHLKQKATPKNGLYINFIENFTELLNIQLSLARPPEGVDDRIGLPAYFVSLLEEVDTTAAQQKLQQFFYANPEIFNSLREKIIPLRTIGSKWENFEKATIKTPHRFAAKILSLRFLIIAMLNEYDRNLLPYTRYLYSLNTLANYQTFHAIKDCQQALLNLLLDEGAVPYFLHYFNESEKENIACFNDFLYENPAFHNFFKVKIRFLQKINKDFRLFLDNYTELAENIAVRLEKISDFIIESFKRNDNSIKYWIETLDPLTQNNILSFSKTFKVLFSEKCTYDPREPYIPDPMACFMRSFINKDKNSLKQFLFHNTRILHCLEGAIDELEVYADLWNDFKKAQEQHILVIAACTGLTALGFSPDEVPEKMDIDFKSRGQITLI